MKIIRFSTSDFITPYQRYHLRSLIRSLLNYSYNRDFPFDSRMYAIVSLDSNYFKRLAQFINEGEENFKNDIWLMRMVVKKNSCLIILKEKSLFGKLRSRHSFMFMLLICTTNILLPISERKFSNFRSS